MNLPDIIIARARFDGNGFLAGKAYKFRRLPGLRVYTTINSNHHERVECWDNLLEGAKSPHFHFINERGYEDCRNNVWEVVATH